MLNHLKFLIIAILMVSVTFAMTNTFEIPEKVTTTTDTDFSNNENPPATEAFNTMMAVLTHKRCVNCHPAGDRPRQGEDSHIHNFNVQRGADGHGVAAVKCESCHQSENNMYSGVPGAPHWHLAPRSMAWEGLSAIEIAESMLDTERNGGRSVEEIEKHLTEDDLVLWVFEPGVDADGIAREKPPVDKETYIKAVKEWVAAGAVIPME
ncbi:MAG: hypothetical protein AB8G22_12945 [Saprospiraceae bacterium]